jgi:hypothetical protein
MGGGPGMNSVGYEPVTQTIPHALRARAVASVRLDARCSSRGKARHGRAVYGIRVLWPSFLSDRERPDRWRSPTTRHHRHRTRRPGTGSAAHHDAPHASGSTLGPTGGFQQVVPRMERPGRGGAPAAWRPADPGGGR